MENNTGILRTMTAGKLAVNIYAGRRRMGEAAAAMVCSKINELLAAQEHLNIIFAAAPSQNELLAALVANRQINWKRVNAFHMDEYLGLPENDRRKFASFLKDRIFDSLPFNTVNYLNGNNPDTDAAARQYARLLTEYPPDIVCMGIGENGHLAFNDPHVADFNDALLVKQVSLDDACRRQQVNDKCFGTMDEVPTHALTLTIPALMAGKYIYCVVSGSNKANAVFNTLNAGISEKCPATILRGHAHANLFLDAGSAALI